MPIVALVDGKEAHLAMDGDGEFKVPEDMTNAEFFHSTAARAMAVYSSLPKNKSIFRFAMSWAGDLGFDASDFTHETNVTSSAEGAGEAAEGGGRRRRRWSPSGRCGPSLCPSSRSTTVRPARATRAAPRPEPAALRSLTAARPPRAEGDIFFTPVEEYNADARITQRMLPSPFTVSREALDDLLAQEQEVVFSSAISQTRMTIGVLGALADMVPKTERERWVALENMNKLEDQLFEDTADEKVERTRRVRKRKGLEGLSDFKEEEGRRKKGGKKKRKKGGKKKRKKKAAKADAPSDAEL